MPAQAIPPSASAAIARPAALARNASVSIWSMDRSMAGPTPRPPGCGAVRGMHLGHIATKSQHVQNQSFTITRIPSARKEPKLRTPTMANSFSTVQGPLPIDPQIEDFRKFPYFGFCAARSLEIARHCQNSCHEDGGINRRQLALPGPCPGPHIEEWYSSGLRQHPGRGRVGKRQHYLVLLLE